jgi:chromosome segregation ATPase
MSCTRLAWPEQLKHFEASVSSSHVQGRLNDSQRLLDAAKLEKRALLAEYDALHRELKQQHDTLHTLQHCVQQVADQVAQAKQLAADDGMSAAAVCNRRV